MLVWRRVVVPILLVLVFGASAAALVKLAFFPGEAEAIVSPQASVSDPVIPVERGSIVNELALQGNIARDDVFEIKSQIAGAVTAVHVGNGAVTAGQRLFTVKQTDPEKLIDVVAPEAGDISEITIVKDQAVNVGDALAALTPARYHLVAAVESVQLYRLVTLPADATVTITGGPEPFTCTEVRVQVSTEGAATVRCDIPRDRTVFAGLPAQLDLPLGQVEDAVVIPTTAVQGGAETGKVWVEGGEGAEPEERSVVLGVNDGTLVEVKEGLAEGDMIRQYVPGFLAPVEEFCYESEPGVEVCESGTSW